MPVRPGLVSRRKKFTIVPNARAWMKIVHRTSPAPTVKGVTIATRGNLVIGLWLVVILDAGRNCANYIKLVLPHRMTSSRLLSGFPLPTSCVAKIPFRVGYAKGLAWLEGTANLERQGSARDDCDPIWLRPLFDRCLDSRTQPITPASAWQRRYQAIDEDWNNRHSHCGR
jgi:hypothetical protein